MFLILPEPEMFKSSVRDPFQEIKPCIAESLEKVLPEYFEKGFYFNPESFLIYSGKEVSYHCYTSSKRSICTRNDAQSKTRIETELKDKIADDIEQCFIKFKDNNKKHSLNMGETQLDIEILPGRILIKTKKELVISLEGEEPAKYSKFDVSISSPLWDFISLSNEIVNQEVSCNCPDESCTADTISLMKNNRDYFIKYEDPTSRSEKVYTIWDDYGNKMMFAVKNCDRSP